MSEIANPELNDPVASEERALPDTLSELRRVLEHLNAWLNRFPGELPRPEPVDVQDPELETTEEREARAILDRVERDLPALERRIDRLMHHDGL